MRTVPTRQADALSKDTTFSGLPKSVLLGANSYSPGAAAWHNVEYDYIVYNYGGYLVGAGAIKTYSSVTIPEPGVYLVSVSMIMDRKTYTALNLGLNGSVFGVPFADATRGVGFYVTADQTATNFTEGMSATVVLQLRQGDILQPQFYFDVAANTNVNSFSVTKIGGAY